MQKYTFYEYFTKFGTIESLRFFDEFGYIQFESADAAEAVISRSSHRIRSFFFCVKAKAAYHWHQPDFVPMQPNQNDDSHILNALDDDCLRVIFERMSLLDLTNAFSDHMPSELNEIHLIGFECVKEVRFYSSKMEVSSHYSFFELNPNLKKLKTSDLRLLNHISPLNLSEIDLNLFQYSQFADTLGLLAFDSKI